jgi:signal recognition particle subunit SEC65
MTTQEVCVEEDKVNPETKTNDSDLDEKSHVEEASKFIQETSLDKMHEIAEAARMKKLMEPPKWVYPNDV